jgi:hypothetical protein
MKWDFRKLRFRQALKPSFRKTDLSGVLRNLEGFRTTNQI